jgi:hypothetical protein
MSGWKRAGCEVPEYFKLMKGVAMKEFEKFSINGRVAFNSSLKSAFSEMADRGVREVWLCDENFVSWPLGERAVVESLNQWVQSNRRLTLVARSFLEFSRHHPRWVTWRRQWSHVVSCHTPLEPEHCDLPCVLLAPGALNVVLLDPAHFRGYTSRETGTELCYRGKVDAILQHCAAAFPVTTAGL